MLPIEFEHNTLSIISQLELDITEFQKERLYQFNQLDELRHEALFQQQRRGWHGKFIKQSSLKKDIGLSSMI